MVTPPAENRSTADLRSATRSLQAEVRSVRRGTRDAHHPTASCMQAPSDAPDLQRLPTALRRPTSPLRATGSKPVDPLLHAPAPGAAHPPPAPLRGCHGTSAPWASHGHGLSESPSVDGAAAEPPRRGLASTSLHLLFCAAWCCIFRESRTSSDACVCRVCYRWLVVSPRVVSRHAVRYNPQEFGHKPRKRVICGRRC
jgi:hypothetical protein